MTPTTLEKLCIALTVVSCWAIVGVVFMFLRAPVRSAADLQPVEGLGAASNDGTWHGELPEEYHLGSGAQSQPVPDAHPLPPVGSGFVSE